MEDETKVKRVLWKMGMKEICHFTKRTHFEFEDFFMYLRYSQTLVTFAEAFANGFVLEKRTHFEALGRGF